VRVFSSAHLLRNGVILNVAELNIQLTPNALQPGRTGIPLAAFSNSLRCMDARTFT